MEWSTACPDWAERLVARKSIIPPPIFPERAEQALEIFKQLRVCDLPGRPTFGECAEQWVFDFVAAIFGSNDPETGNQLIREFYLLISKKNTKALALDTPIPTPDGWTTMGQIRVGDRVFGADGRPCRVTAVSPVYYDHECYRLAFSNGESVVADAGHLWVTSALCDAPGSGGGNGGDLSPRRRRVRTTEEIARTLTRPHDGARNHSLAMPAPIQCEPVDLPVAPYTLGAWLGDGHSGQAKITCHRDDVQILDEIRAEGYPVRYSSNNGSAASTYSLSSGDRSQAARDAGLAAALRRLGVLENKSIPEIYLRASVGQRLALLQGLMDTDGTISKSGRLLVYSGTNQRLVRGVASLLHTLGIKCSVSERQVSCNGKVTGPAWFVQFMAFRDEVPVFRLKRKLDRMRVRGASTARSRTVQITDAVRVPSVPVRCITVDSPDHQFLFGRTMLPTHNSTIAAGIMLTAVILCWREEEEHLIIAPTKEIADNSFKPAAAMVRADEDLSALFHVQDHIRTITNRETRAALKVVAADTDTVSGKKSGRVLVDEHWLFGTKANAASMFMEVLGGQVSRPEGWVIYLTTQSDQPPAGVFKEKLSYARDVRDGRVTDRRFLPVLYEFPPAMLNSKAYQDPANFYITNPNLGRSVDQEWLRLELLKHQHKTDGTLQQFLAKHLNIEIGLALASDRWAGADFWEAAADAGIATLDSVIERSDVCTVGIDGGGLDDLLGLVVLGRDRETRRWLWWAHAWAHKIVLERRQEIATRLLDFEKDGDLTIVGNPGDDVREVADIVCRLRDEGLLPEKHAIGVDAAGIGAVIDELTSEDRSIEIERITAVQQGWKLNGAIKTTERLLAGGDIIHGGRPLMAWCVGNAKVVQVGNAMTITKQASGTAKIDPLMAGFSAVSMMSLNPQPAKSYWE